MTQDARQSLEDRFQRLRERMRADEVDVLLVSPSADYRYLTGLIPPVPTRLTFLVAAGRRRDRARHAEPRSRRVRDAHRASGSHHARPLVGRRRSRSRRGRPDPEPRAGAAARGLGSNVGQASRAADRPALGHADRRRRRVDRRGPRDQGRLGDRGARRGRQPRQRGQRSARARSPGRVAPSAKRRPTSRPACATQGTRRCRSSSWRAGRTARTRTGCPPTGDRARRRRAARLRRQGRELQLRHRARRHRRRADRRVPRGLRDRRPRVRGRASPRLGSERRAKRSTRPRAR